MIIDSNKISLTLMKFLILLYFFTNVTYANNRDINVITVGGGNKGGMFIKIAKSLCEVVNRHYL